MKTVNELESITGAGHWSCIVPAVPRGTQPHRPAVPRGLKPPQILAGEILDEEISVPFG